MVNKAVANLQDDADLVISQRELTDRARKHAPNSRHVSVDNFMNSPVYDWSCRRSRKAPPGTEPTAS